MLWENLFHSMALGTFKGKHVALYNPGKDTRVLLCSIQPVGGKNLWNDSKLFYSAA